jgi:hypothetical protein
MVNKVFKHQLRRIIKGYMDDILVKSMTFKQHFFKPIIGFFFAKSISNEAQSLKLCIFHQGREVCEVSSK